MRPTPTTPQRMRLLGANRVPLRDRAVLLGPLMAAPHGREKWGARCAAPPFWSDLTVENGVECAGELGLALEPGEALDGLSALEDDDGGDGLDAVLHRGVEVAVGID